MKLVRFVLARTLAHFRARSLFRAKKLKYRILFVYALYTDTLLFLFSSCRFYSMFNKGRNGFC